MKAKLLFLFAGFLTLNCVAQPGSLDLTFGTGGKVTTTLSNGNDTGSDVVIQPDGKIIVAGTDSNFTEFGLVRYNSNGSLDNTFGVGGKVRTNVTPDNDNGTSLALLDDGTILLAGTASFKFTLLRYAADGSLDNTFDTDGIVLTDIGPAEDVAHAMAVQDDGKIVLAGNSFIFNGTANTYDFTVVRLNSDGSLDNTFGSGGKVMTPIGTSDDFAYSVAVQSDGKIIVAGETRSPSPDFILSCVLVRYNSNGTLDNTFGTGGIRNMPLSIRYNSINAVTLQSDGQILVAGTTSNHEDSLVFSMARLNDNGSFDNTFGTNGVVFTAFASTHSLCFGMEIQGDGKIILSGRMHAGFSPNFFDFAVARYNLNGSLDNTFGSGGKVTTHMGWPEDTGYGIAVQTDGKIVVAGAGVNAGVDSDFTIARYNGEDPTGITENDKETDLTTFPNPFSSQTILKTDKVLKNATLTLYNSLGQQLRQVNNISGQTVTLYRDNLPNGLYTFQLTQDNQTIAAGKLVIAE